MAKIQWGRWDNIIMGMLLGVALLFPSFSFKVSSWIVPLIPDSFYVFGDLSLPIIGIVIGGIGGYIVGKTQ